MRENHLRWFGHVQLRSIIAPVIRNYMVLIGFKRTRGRPIMTWVKVLRNYMSASDLMEDMALYRMKWQNKSCTANLN